MVNVVWAGAPSNDGTGDRLLCKNGDRQNHNRCISSLCQKVPAKIVKPLKFCSTCTVQ